MNPDLLFCRLRRARARARARARPHRDFSTKRREIQNTSSLPIYSFTMALPVHNDLFGSLPCTFDFTEFATANTSGLYQLLKRVKFLSFKQIVVEEAMTRIPRERRRDPMYCFLARTKTIIVNQKTSIERIIPAILTILVYYNLGPHGPDETNLRRILCELGIVPANFCPRG